MLYANVLVDNRLQQTKRKQPAKIQLTSTKVTITQNTTVHTVVFYLYGCFKSSYPVILSWRKMLYVCKPLANFFNMYYNVVTTLQRTKL